MKTITHPDSPLLPRFDRALKEHGLQFSAYSNYPGDMAWDVDMTMQEKEHLRGVEIASATNLRQISVAVIRGEVRYCLTTDRSPEGPHDWAENELGVLRSIEDAFTLCAEFLNSALALAELRTPRVAGKRRLGVWPSSSTP